MIVLMTRHAYIADGIGERIRRLRKERGWTQAEFAERIGCSRRAIVYYERDGKYPPTPILAAMAGAFGINIESLIDPEEPRQRSKVDDPNLLESEDRRLWKKFLQLKHLSERDQATVFRMINAMKNA